MSTSPAPASAKPDYARILPPILGAICIVAIGTGIVFSLRGLGFARGVIGIAVASTLVVLIMGGAAWIGAYFDRRTGREITFRLVGAGIGFIVLTAALYQTAPIVLGPASISRE